MKPVDQRLIDLEIKASYTDDLLEQLNQMVAQQQQTLAALQREVLQLRRQVREQGGPAPLGQFDERPPHY